LEGFGAFDFGDGGQSSTAATQDVSYVEDARTKQEMTMDSSIAGTSGVKGQIRATLQAKLDKGLAELLVEFNKQLKVLVEGVTDDAIELTRRGYLEMLAHGEPPAHLVFNPLSAAPSTTPTASETATGTCIVPGCPRRGAKSKNGFCLDHYEKLGKKEKNQYLEAHKEKRRAAFNQQRKQKRRQAKGQSGLASGASSSS
jgi:hypothetical protein